MNNPIDLNDPHMKWVVALALAFKRVGATHSPIEPDAEVILNCLRGVVIHDKVLAWLGYWMDQLPPKAVEALQGILKENP